ncbi:MAG TPA: hypothetical protein VLZ10_13290, partial [Thermodesulfobacteriota bacterium]|nr:hypothetical protein [Thermodesulfobacteriota bacterium]
RESFNQFSYPQPLITIFNNDAIEGGDFESRPKDRLLNYCESVQIKIKIPFEKERRSKEHAQDFKKVYGC